MTGQTNTSAIILAAGLSRRMGEHKPLMDLGGQTIVERMVALYRQAGVVDIRVVTGHRAEAVRSALSNHPVTEVHNSDYESGMFSSVLAGIGSLPATTRAFFVHPVDIPLVRPHTLSRLMDASHQASSTIVYPVFNDRRGHPPLIHRKLEDAVAAHDARGGLRALLERFDSTAMDIQVADEGVLLDLDTPEDYQRLSARLATAHALTDRESRVLMEKIQNQPPPVSDHCQQVARVAASLADAVVERTAGIDILLIRSAALVHDMARNQPDHAAAGADLLNQMGFPAMAAIVAVHMDIEVRDDSSLDEAQIVYLADKLVEGETVVNLTQRFDAKLRKFGHDSQVTAHIIRRKQAARMIQGKIERISGMTIDQLLEKAATLLEDGHETHS